MAIYRLLQRGAFGPDDITLLAAAYERTLNDLKLVDRNDPVTELVAAKVIEVFRSGLRDPAQVSANVLKEIG